MPRALYSFYIDPGLAAALKALKARDGMPESEAVRRALAEFMRKKRIAVAEPRKRRPTRARS